MKSKEQFALEEVGRSMRKALASQEQAIATWTGSEAIPQPRACQLSTLLGDVRGRLEATIAMAEAFSK